MNVFLVVDCLDYGDGVSNDVLAHQELFRKLGYKCEIYTQVYDERVKNLRKDISELSCHSDDLLLHHYSGYSNIVEKIQNQPGKKVMVYHNITPPELVEGEIKTYCEMGLSQIVSLRGKYDAIIGDSKFNIECLIKMGVIDRGDVLPIPVEFATEVSNNHPIRPSALRFLFVGRYAPNKRLEDIIDAFCYYWQTVDRKATLHLVGNPNVDSHYTEMLKEKIRYLPCCDAVFLTGKVSDEQLQEYYNHSDVFLCMSEHEGFCIPLLEAMWHKLPVFAFDAGAVRETMGESGVVFTDKTPMIVGESIAAVMHDRQLVASIIEKQNARILDFSKEKVEAKLKELVENWMAPKENQSALQSNQPLRKLKIQMQGPFETSYSLAQVNRFLAEALHNTGSVDMSIRCTEGNGDYFPKELNLFDKPLAKMLWIRGKTAEVPDVALRNMFPPVVTGLTAQLNFQAFGWEEDRVPRQYIEWFNDSLDGIGTMSEFVTEALKDSGLTIPVKTMGIGVRLPENYDTLSAYPLQTHKTVKFLHISSAFPRKGVDVLLENYFATFTEEDDVCLVLKTFPNPHNRTVELLSNLRRKYPHGPEVEHINDDLPEEMLYGLYKAASCYVHCARGEGFGLPVAEAMLAKIPTIVCNNTGLADFCTEDTCLTVGYRMVPAHSHVTENSKWAEPDVAQLCERMRQFVAEPNSEAIRQKTENAYWLISTRFTWKAVAENWLAFINEVRSNREKPQVDMVTTWNSKCGIAEFTRYFVENSNQLVDYRIFPDRNTSLLREDESFVQKRVWDQGDDISTLIAALEKSSSPIVHIQYNFNFFHPKELGRLCRRLQKKKKVVILFHGTKNLTMWTEKKDWRQVIDDLNCAYRIVVHQKEDVDCLVGFGVHSKRIMLIPHGQIVFPNRSIEQSRAIMGIASSPVIGSYGFLLPHKGIEKVIRAIGILKEKYPNILYVASCSLYDADISRDYCIRCCETIKELGLENNVLLFTDFLEPKESAILLQSCDMLIMPYDLTNESASGAIRFCIAAKRPLITTEQAIFREYSDCTYQIKDNAPDSIAVAIEKMMDCKFANAYTEKIDQVIEKSCWHSVIKKYLPLYQERAD